MKQKLQPILGQFQRARSKFSKLPQASMQVRDLTLIHLAKNTLLVVAVDSDGAIGPKSGDVVRITGREAGRFAARVPLMEILACGAVPIAAFDSLAVEMDPTGKAIIEGVKEELRSIGLPESFPLSGSTEDNVPTTQTGIGVTILGLVEKKHFRPGTSKPGDSLFCIGSPKSGPTDVVSIDDKSIADSATVAALNRMKGVHDILPVGSKGIRYEAGQLAMTAGLALEVDANCPLDLLKSAGPSTCFIISADTPATLLLRSTTPIPVYRIGRLGKRR